MISFVLFFFIFLSPHHTGLRPFAPPLFYSIFDHPKLTPTLPPIFLFSSLIPLITISVSSVISAFQIHTPFLLKYLRPLSSMCFFLVYLATRKAIAISIYSPAMCTFLVMSSFLNIYFPSLPVLLLHHPQQVSRLCIVQPSHHMPHSTFLLRLHLRLTLLLWQYLPPTLLPRQHPRQIFLQRQRPNHNPLPRQRFGSFSCRVSTFCCLLCRGRTFTRFFYHGNCFLLLFCAGRPFIYNTNSCTSCSNSSRKMIILCALVVNHLPTKRLNLHADATLSPIPKTYKTALLDPH
jgi:hypothetical protein